MKRYKKRIKCCVITFVMFMVYLTSVFVCYAENQYDTYYMDFKNSEENHISIQLGQEQMLFTNDSDLIDLENLEFFSQDINIHYSFSAETSDIDTLTVEARKHLLRYGYAKLINLDIASDDEKESQQYAQEMKLGIWELTSEEPDAEEPDAEEPDAEEPDTEELGTDENGANDVEDSYMIKIKKIIAEKWQALCLWFMEEKEFIISTLVGCGILAFIARKIIRFLRTKKKIIFFGGANSAGKTTMSQYLMNPDASREDLINQEPSLNSTKERIVRDDTNRKLTLKACLLDSPGHELEYVIDELSLTLRARIFRKKYVVIIMVAPTKSNKNRNDIDREYINDQLNTISKLWFAVLKAKRIVKPEAVILFINKLDLFDDGKKMVSEFSEHRKQLKKICDESNIKFFDINGSVLDKSGMTKLMQILKK